MSEAGRWAADPELSGRPIAPPVSSRNNKSPGPGESVYLWQPSPLSRLIARLRAGHFDRLLASGAAVPMGSALEVHAQRLVSVTERETIARTLMRAVRETAAPITAPLLPLPLVSARVPFHRDNITAAEAEISTVTLLLHSPRPVAARGMARLRLLLTDGAGPFYRHGRGDLEARLTVALADLSVAGR